MGGNTVYIDQNYIAGVSDMFGAKLHRHPLTEIYVSFSGTGHVMTQDQMLEGPVIAVGAGTVHAIADRGKPGIALFVDPVTSFGYSLSKQILNGAPYTLLMQDEALSLPGATDGIGEEEIRNISERLLEKFEGTTFERPFDEAVLRTVDYFCDDSCTFEMEEAAEHVHLSKSRLAHLFSEQTGITLKEYIQYKRLERACRKMLSGESITDAAFDTGFSGSSHIAASSIRLTGMQLRRMLNL